jgi:hypothetical protein
MAVIIAEFFHVEFAGESMRRELREAWGAVLFIFYCTAIGTYLVLRPWAVDAQQASPYLRGFVSGLGLLHLGAAAVDFRGLLRRLGPVVQDPR